MNNNSKREALVIAIKYLVFGTLWILFSDFFVEMIFENTRLVQTIKGIVYVLVSAAFIYLLTWQKIRQITKANEKLKQANKSLEEINEKLLDREKKLEDSQKRYELALKGVEGIWDYNFETKEFKGSNWIRRTLGKDNFNFIEKIEKIIHPDDLDKFYFDLNRYLRKEIDAYRSLFRVKNSEGEYIWMMFSGSAIWDETGKPLRMVGLASDFSEQIKLTKRVEELAYFDQETDLPNSNSAYQEVSDLIEGEADFSLIYIGIDNFLQIENAKGSDYISNMLNTIKVILSQHKDKYAYLSYFGNFEFLMITKYGDEKELVDSVYKSFDNYWLNKDLLYYTSLSIGIEQFKYDINDIKTSDQLIKNVRLAMLEARKLKGNSCLWFNEDMSQSNLEDINLEEQLRKALIEDQFFLEYQPIFNLKDNRIFALEALIRWKHPKRGVLYPDSFINFAEKAQLIQAIGQFVIRESIKQLSKWHKIGFSDLIISINMSPVEFNQANLAELILKTLNEFNVDSKYLRIEITENVLIENFENAKRILEELRKNGVKVSLDDYGIGYSSFKYLQELPIQILKIDKSFIMKMNYKKNRDFVKSAIDLGKSLGIKVVAEGVEDPSSSSFLLENGCDYAQGYYFQKPTDVKTIEKLLKTKGITKARES